MPWSHFARPLAVAAAAFVALILYLGRGGGFDEPPPSWNALAGRSARFQAEVLTGFVETRQGERFELLAAPEEQSAAPAHALTHAQAPAQPARVLAYFSRGARAEDLRPGQTISVLGRLRRPRRALNPGDFDEEAWLRRKGIGFVLHAGEPRILRDAPRLSPAAWAESTHRSVQRFLKRRYGPDQRALLGGLLLGFTGPLDPGLKTAVQSAGAMHLLVPSGTNMAWIAGLCLGLSALLGLGAAARWALTAGAGGFFGLMAGFEPPFARAYVSALAALAALPLQRGAVGFQALVYSVWALCLTDPRSALGLGFQMSYVVVLGLMVSLPRLRLPPRWPGWARAVGIWLLMSVVAQLWLLPFLANAFGRAAAAGVISNALLIPLSGAATALGWLAWLTDLEWIAWSAGAAIDLFIAICRWSAALPYASIEMAAMGPVRVAAYYAGLTAFVGSSGRGRCAGGAAMAAALAIPAAQPLDRAVFLFPAASKPAVLAAVNGRHLWLGAPMPEAAEKRLLRAVGVTRVAQRRGLEIPYRLRLNDMEVALSRDGVHRVRLGPIEFCILQRPASVETGCDRSRTAETRRGAVWIETDGSKHSIRTRKKRDPLGRIVL